MKSVKAMLNDFTRKRLERKAYRKVKKLEKICYGEKHETLFLTLHFATMFENKLKEWQRYEETPSKLKIPFLRGFISSIVFEK